jgi:glucose/arabinose dehydrogenase/PKD repeat protein
VTLLACLGVAFLGMTGSALAEPVFPVMSAAGGIYWRAAPAAFATGGAAPSLAVTGSSCPPASSSAYAGTIAAEPGLLGYWRLDEQSGSIACDVTGVNGGTYAGSVVLGAGGALTGDPDTAARFSSGGEVTVPHQAALDLNGAFTIEAWVKPETPPSSGFPAIMRKGSSWRTDDSGGWLLWYAHDTQILRFKRQNVEASTPSWQLGPPGTWSYIAVTYDGTASNTLRFYLNGTPAGSTAGPTGGYLPLTSTDPLEIGRGDDTSSDQTVDEPAIYSVALSDTAIQQHYQAGKGMLGAPTAPTNLTVNGGSSQATLQWGASSDTNLVGYRIYRRNADGSWPTTPIGTSTTTSYADGSVSTGIGYTYRVTAYDATNLESSPSNEASLSLPIGFQTATLVTGLDQPTAVAWVPDGRMFVAEKTGILRVVGANGLLVTALVLDFQNRVNAYEDRGFLGLAADSDFASNHYLYLLYTYELNTASPDSSAPMVSRLTRITVNPDNTLSGSETVLLGSVASGPCSVSSNTNDCIPSDGTSHSIGTVRADPDGTLWIGSGDGTPYATVDPNAFRTYDEQSFAGKILHVDRSGRGLTGHQFCPSDTDLSHVCTKIYAKGFRNPFRFSLRSGAGPIVGDVGGSTREEIDVLDAGRNYGWPCYEGSTHTPGYSDDSKCAAEYAKEGTSSADTLPAYEYAHADLGGGGAIIAGPVYTGSAYPASYSGTVFFGDYVHGFVRRLALDGQGQVTGVADFMRSGWLGVDLEQAPDGSIVWVDPGNFGNGEGAIRKWIYTAPGSNQPPTAIASATPLLGPPPLTVQFKGDGSSDPEGDSLVYDWNFGDSTSHSNTANPSHTYSSIGTYTAVLRVDDGHSHSSSASLTIRVAANTPPTATITAPVDNSTYRDGQVVPLSASGADFEDGTLPSSAFSWHVILHHGTGAAAHIHDLGTFAGSATRFTTKTDHDADSYYEIFLTVTDSGGLTASRSVTIRPQTIKLTIASNPTGAPVSFAGTAYTAPVTVTTAVGFQTTVSAPATFVSGGHTYTFKMWSDHGAQVHTITVPTTNNTLTASYRK